MFYTNTRSPVNSVLRRTQRLPEGDVVAVRILDSELAEAVRRVVDRVVDLRSALLHLGVDRVGVVDADVGVPRLVHDAPVGDDPLRVGAEREQDRRLVAGGDAEVRRM